MSNGRRGGRGWGLWYFWGNLLGRSAPRERKGYSIVTECTIVLLEALSAAVLGEILVLIFLYLCSHLRETFIGRPLLFFWTHPRCAPLSFQQHLRWIGHHFLTWGWITGLVPSCILGFRRFLEEVTNPFSQQQKWTRRVMREFMDLSAETGMPPEGEGWPVFPVEGIADEDIEGLFEEPE